MMAGSFHHSNAFEQMIIKGARIYNRPEEMLSLGFRYPKMKTGLKIPIFEVYELFRLGIARLNP